jgi:hypothetical protein
MFSPEFPGLQGFCEHVAEIPAIQYLERQQELARTLKATNASALIAEGGFKRTSFCYGSSAGFLF